MCVGVFCCVSRHGVHRIGVMGYGVLLKNKLTDKGLKSLPKGSHGDGGGLWFRKNSATSQQWIFRYTYAKKQKNLGLGSYPGVSLAEARRMRDKWAEVVRNGQDPAEVKRQEQAELLRGSLDTSLQSIAEEARDARSHSLKEGGTAGRWFSPVKIHVLSKLGDLSVETITQIDIRDALKPIWHDKADTARKAIGRLKYILEYAENKGLEVDVEIIRKAKGLLGKQVVSTEHHQSMPWEDVPSFYASLDQPNQTQLGLRFLILNPGPRSKPVRFLRLEQIKE